MFGAFRYSKTTKDYEHVELSNDNIDARGHVLVACDSCRTRKLKCNGNRNSCDRCLASPSRTCTYISRKRPRQASMPPASESLSSESNRAKPRKLTEKRRVEEPISSDASSISVSGSATSAPSSAPSPSISMTMIEPLPTPTFSNFPWELFEEFTDLDEFKQGQMVPSPNVDWDLNLLDNMQSPFTPPSWPTPDSHVSSVAIAQKSQDIPDRDQELGFEYSGHQHEQAKQVELQSAPTPALYLSQLAGKEVSCKCLSTMTQLLEDIGVSVDTTAIDALLMCLGRGTKMSFDILACIHCNACVENTMLFTTIAQQLVSTAKKITSALLLVHHKSQEYDDNNWKSRSVVEMGDGGITFGSYRIELPEMKVRLIYKIVHLHLEDLQKLLASIKERIGPKKGAWGLLADAESKAAKICWMIQELSK